MADSILRQDARARVAEIGEADIVVGIPSYNNARTVAHVVRAVIAGLAKYFDSERSILVSSDGGSTDGTPEAVAQADFGSAQAILTSHPARPVQKVITAYQGIPGKGSAFRTIFEIAQRLGARACAVVDADLRSISPEWIQLLIGPILDHDFDYVCPLYARHKYDGTITNSIVYPMVRALYGKRIRQPIGGDFGFSGRLASSFLGHDVWGSDVARYGIDIWMTTTALCGDFRVCQSYLGAKIHDAKDPGADLTAMLVQVTGSLFRQMEEHASLWPGIEGSQAVPEFGFRYEVGLEPMNVNVASMVGAFDRGVKDFGAFYSRILSRETRGALEQLLGQDPGSFEIPTDLWVRIVYEFAAAYHHRAMTRDHLLKSLTPLYLGRTASWVCQAAAYDSQDVEDGLDALCGRFESLKPYLQERWQEGRVQT
jgi:glucosylglycerate synthase